MSSLNLWFMVFECVVYGISFARVSKEFSRHKLNLLATDYVKKLARDKWSTWEYSLCKKRLEDIA